MKVDDLMDIEIEEIQKGFNRFDYNKTGTIRTDDVGNALRWLKLVPTEAQIRELSEIVDPNGIGTVKFKAFLVIAAEIWIPQQKREGKIWAAFLFFDKEDKGKLTVEQMQQILLEIGEEPLTQKEVKTIINKFANKKDKTIEYGYIIREWQE
ncbi:unnamed protein product [Mesocestoides corti]|uniref:EF-hand domain-containing protein n=1 Tax=Mesocestoides corti TaxID=53468 RepID=A0A0R3UJD2_MESCO|nr:unnamed protein product [Mesocestoides corti]